MIVIANHDQVITSAIRGFSGGELVSLLQFRPSMALLGLLYHRLSTVDDPYINLRKCVAHAVKSPSRGICYLSFSPTHTDVLS